MKFRKTAAAVLAAVLAVSAPLAGAVNNALSVTAGAEETEGTWSYRVLDDDTISLTQYIGSETDIVIPSTYEGMTVSQLNDRFFEDENSRKTITSLTIPASVDIGGDGTTHNGDVTWRLSRLLTLESINISEDNPYYSSVDGIMYNKDKTVLKYYPNAKKDSIYTIPDTVKDIDRFAFYTNDGDYTSSGEELKRISYPSLKCITLSNNTAIDDNPFEYCSALTEIRANDENPDHTVIDGVLFNKDMTELLAYPSAKEGTSYIIPDSVKSIASANAFSICPALKSISLSKNTCYLGLLGTTASEFVFNNCTALEEINVGEENETYSSVDGVLFNKNKSRLKRFPRAKNDAVYKIPNGVTTLDGNAFMGCTALTEILIPNSVTVIFEGAFKDCTSLTNVIFEGSQEEWNNVSIGEWGNDYLTNATISFAGTTVSEPETSTPVESTVTPGGTDPVSEPDSSTNAPTVLEATLKNVDSENGLSGEQLDKQLFGDSGWTWAQVEKIVFTSDKLFSVQYTAVDGSIKTLGEKPAQRAEDDGIWNTEWTLDTSLMSKDKSFVKLIAKDGTADIKATIYIKKDAAKPSTGSDQADTGIALAIAPIAFAASAVIVASKKKK